MPFRSFTIGLTVLVAGFAGGTAGHAQSTNAQPDLYMSDKMVDLPTLPVSEDARKALALYVGQPAGAAGFVFASSGDTRWWAFAVRTPTLVESLSDLGREALEKCEYYNRAPCFLTVINGHDTRRPDGSWATQPTTLFHHSSTFDSSVVPFVQASDRPIIAAYGALTGSRAMMLTTGGGWLYRSGTTVLQAIDTAENDCPSTYKDATCILYAVGDRVVFDAN